MPLSSMNLALPVVVIFIAIFVGAIVVANSSSFYGRLIEGESKSQRFHSIDGLRGFLALGVAFHHVAISQQLYQTGVWTLPLSRLGIFLGRGGVAMFFMTTAFLFWNRISYGKSPFDAVKFLSSRVRRLAPMYLVVSIAAIVTALAVTHFRLAVTWTDLLSQTLSWLLFTVPGTPDINGLPKTFVINGVFWSLIYEWKFYLLLPLLAVFKSRSGKLLLCSIATLYISLLSEMKVEWFFLTGALAAVVVQNKRFCALAKRPYASIVALLFIGGTVVFEPLCYTIIGAALLFLPFAIIAAGNTLFGCLTSKPARLLGMVSYSIYLLHSWILYLISRLVNHFSNIAEMSAPEYWILGGVVVMVTVAISLLTYQFIEFQFIKPSNPSVEVYRRDSKLGIFGK